MNMQGNYNAVPQVLQRLKRWCGYKIIEREDPETGKKNKTKIPFNAVTGQWAKSNDENTWTDFETALNGIKIFHFDGLGIMLGDGLTGIDLDNHPNDDGEFPMTNDEFIEWANQAVDFMDSYAEWSPSGKGVHILCCGQMPSGRNRNHKVVDGLRRDVEMYGYKRFFTVTGKVIRQSEMPDRSEKLMEFWKKYVDDSEELALITNNYVPTGVSNISDQDLLDKAYGFKNGNDFKALYEGDISSYNDDHSQADLALCDKLAWLCNGDISQIDRMFRKSGLYREKWDRPMKDSTYGMETIRKAISGMRGGYEARPRLEIGYAVENGLAKDISDASSARSYMTIDENNQPIFNIPVVLNDSYSNDDTGNAKRFYDYFGPLFKYNKKSDYFMYWTGKTWIEDDLDIIDKYVDKMTDIMTDELDDIKVQIKSAEEDEDEDLQKELEGVLKAKKMNITRLRNTSGLNSMKERFSSIKDIPVRPEDFNKEEYLLNTESGIVDLRDGSVLPFERNKMMSMNTHCEVSYEEPTLWKQFLSQIFKRGDGKTEKEIKETEELIDIVQQIVGLALTGYTREQKLFMLVGGGSNGKSTFINTISKIMGDYSKKIDSSVLISAKNGNNTNVQFSLATLVGTRLLLTSETDEDERMSEKTVKDMTGEDIINARELYGKPFEFLPQFNVFMCTNNLPIIRGNDYGIWRRIFIIPFVQTFKEADKDPDLPRKLEAEAPKILGWCIKGYQKYIENGARLTTPDFIKSVVSEYKDDMDVVARFLNKCCHLGDDEREQCTTVYKAYKEWARDNTDFTMKENNFYKNLKSKGFVTVNNFYEEEVYTGLCLLSSVKERMNNNNKFGSSTDFDFTPRG